jgi:hypothetical protein
VTIEIDVALDPTTGDMVVPTRLITGLELIQQRIRRRLQRGTGEWFLDPAGTGLPLLAWREQKPPRIAQILQRLQDEIKAVPGVVATANFTGTHDVAAHQLTVTGDVIVDDGTVTAVVVTAPTAGRPNSMSFGVFFSSNNIRGGIPRPSRGRP